MSDQQDTPQKTTTFEDLEQKNRELTQENSALIQKITNLSHINELKTNFLGLTSHELKNPLTSIKGYTEILLDSMSEKLSPESFSIIERISRSANTLHNIINDMLDVSRIENYRLQLKPTNIDLRELIKRCFDELNLFFVQRSIKHELICNDSIPTFFGDPVRICQVFTNLLSNAIKYSPDNTTVIVTITVQNNLFSIIVKDQGIGIPSEEQNKIFAPFYEISRTMDHSSHRNTFMGGGTGLGLAIAKGLVQRHGGSIWVESHGSGSEFHISLPLTPTVNWSDDTTHVFALQSIMEQENSPRLKQKVPKKIVTNNNSENSDVLNSFTRKMP